jgi:hypothetical protein
MLGERQGREVAVRWIRVTTEADWLWLHARVRSGLSGVLGLPGLSSLLSEAGPTSPAFSSQHMSYVLCLRDSPSPESQVQHLSIADLHLLLHSPWLPFPMFLGKEVATINKMERIALTPELAVLLIAPGLW